MSQRIHTCIALEALSLAGDWTRLSKDLAVLFYMRGDDLCAVWQPRRPSAKTLRRVAPRYVAARDDFLESVAQRIGGRVLVIGAPNGRTS